MKYLIFTITIFLALLNPAKGQEQWDLTKCIDYALENNLDIKQADLQSQINKDLHSQNKYNRLPNLNGFGSHSYNFGQRIDPFTNQFANTRVQSNNFYLNSQVVLFNGFRTNNQIQRSNLNYELSQKTVEKIKNNIVLSIASTYLQILFNEELLKIAENQAATTRVQLKRIEKLIKAGSLPQGNLLEIQSQLATEELQIVNAENQLTLSYLTLKQMMQLDNENDFTIAKPNIVLEEGLIITSAPGQVYQQALTTMPEVQEADLQMKTAAQDIQIANSANYPTLSLSGSVGTGYSGASKEVVDAVPVTYVSGQTESGENVYSQDFVFEMANKPFMDQLKDNINQTVGLNLSVPIFNNFSAKYSVSQAKYSYEIAKLNQESVKNQLKNDIEQAYTDAVSALKKYESTKQTVTSLSKNFEYAEKRFEAGVINGVDFNLAKNRLAEAQSNLLQAKFDYVFKTKILDFYQGKPIVL